MTKKMTNSELLIRLDERSMETHKYMKTFKTETDDKLEHIKLENEAAHQALGKKQDYSNSRVKKLEIDIEPLKPLPGKVETNGKAIDFIMGASKAITWMLGLIIGVSGVVFAVGKITGKW